MIDVRYAQSGDVNIAYRSSATGRSISSSWTGDLDLEVLWESPEYRRSEWRVFAVA